MCPGSLDGWDGGEGGCGSMSNLKLDLKLDLKLEN